MLELYENIRDRRIELKMTQDELARRAGYSDRSAIAKIESGKVDLPQSKIETFAGILNVSPAYLMGWTDEKPIINSKMEKLITICSGLNDAGQDKVINYASDLRGNAQYTAVFPEAEEYLA